MENVSSSNGLEKYPKLRFPCFDQPYIVSPLSNYLFENTERNRDLLFDKEDVLSVSGEFGVVNQIEFQGRSFAGESVAEYHVVNTNDVVYTKSPLKANPYGIIKTNKGVPGIVSTLYAVYHPKECTDPLYVEYYFGNDLRLNKFLKPLVNIGAKHDMKVNNEFVLTGEVCFPSVIEQQKIVQFLSCLDRRIEKQRCLVEHLKKYKRGLLDAIFNQKIHVTDGNEEWQECRIGDILKILHGRDYKDYQATNGEYPVLGTGGVIDHATKYLCDWPCVLIGRKGTIDKPQYMDTPFWTVDTLFYSKPEAFHNPKFQYYLFQTINWKKYNEASGVPSQSSSTIEGISVYVPNLKTQETIARLFSNVDELIEKQTSILSQLQESKKGLLQQLFI